MGSTPQRIVLGNAWCGLVLVMAAAAPVGAFAEDAPTPRDAGPPGATSKAGEGPTWNSGSPAERVLEGKAPADNAKSSQDARSSERKPPENRPLASTRPEDQQQTKEPTKD